MIVENKTGAAGSIAAQAVKLAPADGYTLMMTISGTMFTNRVLYKTLPYDADKDFVLISCLPGPAAFRRAQVHRRDRPGGVCRLCTQPRGELRLLWAGFRRSHHQRAAQQALRPQHAHRALSRRGADVAGHADRYAAGGMRQLCRRRRPCSQRGPAGRLRFRPRNA